MDVRSNAPLLAVTTAAAILLAVSVALFAVYLLTEGTVLTTVTEVPYGEPMPTPTIARVPYRPAAIPLTASVLLIAGLLARHLSVAWASLAILFLFSGLFVFSWGLAFLPGAVLLLVLLLVIMAGRRTTGRDQAG